MGRTALRDAFIHFASSLQTHAEIDLAGQFFNFDVGLDDHPRISQGQYGLQITTQGKWLLPTAFRLIP